MNKANKNKIILATLLILGAALTRLLPHPPNFTSIAAIGLFGGAIFENKKISYLLPLSALLLSDILLQIFTTTPGIYSGMFFVYGSFMLITWMGHFLRRISVKNVVAVSMAASILFFLITNFGVWAMGNSYPKTGAGLLNCYLAGIPFFGNTLLGDLFYVTILFGLYRILPSLLKKQPSLQG